MTPHTLLAHYLHTHYTHTTHTHYTHTLAHIRYYRYTRIDTAQSSQTHTATQRPPARGLPTAGPNAPTSCGNKRIVPLESSVWPQRVHIRPDPFWPFLPCQAWWSGGSPNGPPAGHPPARIRLRSSTVPHHQIFSPVAMSCTSRHLKHARP